MKCKVCGSEISGKCSQCRKCGTVDKPFCFWKKLNIFSRLEALELQNQKQAAVIMKLWKLVEEKGRPLPVEESGQNMTAEEFVSWVNSQEPNQ